LFIVSLFEISVELTTIAIVVLMEKKYIHRMKGFFYIKEVIIIKNLTSFVGE
jgi:hypothetical protein